MNYELLNWLQHGYGAVDNWTITVNRIVLGLFFAIAGYHKLFNPQRRALLLATFQKLHVPAIRFNMWWVPMVEFLGGLALISGTLAPLAATGLVCICVVAACTDGRKRLAEKHPIDLGDRINNLLYLPEVLYIFGLTIIIEAGPGSWTLPNLAGRVLA